MDTKRSILIVDDEQSTGLVLSHFLQDEYEVTLKLNGMEAMAWLESGNDVDLIISDLNMPNLNGKEMLKILQASYLYSYIPVILLSGQDESKERIECLELGADDFMLKPFNPREVKAKINAILRRIEKQVK